MCAIRSRRTPRASSRLIALYRTMARIRAFENAAEIASQGGVQAWGLVDLRQAGAGARTAAPVDRAGGRRRRRLREPHARRPAHLHPSRPRPHAGQGRRRQPHDGRAVRHARPAPTRARAARCTSPTSRRHARRERRRRRRHADRRRRRACAQDSRPPGNRRLLLRRRRGQPRAVPRSPELGRRLPACPCCSCARTTASRRPRPPAR